MFTLQAGEIQRLASLGLPRQAAEHMQNVFANCNQSLEHRGPVNFTGDVLIPNGRIGQWGIALYNWEYEENPPSVDGSLAWVWVRRTNELGKTPDYDSEEKVLLPCPPSKDPNVIAGQIVYYYNTSSGVWVAPGYWDDAIGSVKSHVTKTALQGWGVMDGVANAASLGGSALDATNRFLRQFNTSGQLGTTGGSATASLSDHTAAQVNALIDDHSGESTNSAGAHDHGGATGSTALVDHYHSLTTSSLGVDGTGSTPTDVVTGACSSDAREADCTTDEDLAHTHTITNEAAHSHTIPNLSHSGTGNLTHDSINLDPLFAYVSMLERLNNSRNVVQKGVA